MLKFKEFLNGKKWTIEQEIKNETMRAVDKKNAGI